MVASIERFRLPLNLKTGIIGTQMRKNTIGHHTCSDYTEIDSPKLTNDSMEDRKCGILLGNLEIGIENPQLPRVLKGVGSEAEQVEEAAEGPDVSLLVDGLVAVQVDHLRSAVHGGCVALNLKQNQAGT